MITALCSQKRPGIDVRPVELQSRQDIMDLADMRYREWIQQDQDDECDDDDDDDKTSAEKTNNTPSLGAFRMATAEILQERTREGSVTFLARITKKVLVEGRSSSSTVVVGSAELSPIELKGLVPNVSYLKAPNNHKHKWLYVTDVVTSTNYRRLGVGTALMDAMEDAAISQNSFNETITRIYLHVCPDNIKAMEFYTKRGYQTIIVQSRSTNNRPEQEQVDATKLAEAAGAIGQTLLCKELALMRDDAHDPNVGVGFGSNKETKQKTKGGSNKKGFGKKKKTKTKR